MFISGVSYADSIGDIVESTGVGSILRNNMQLPHEIDTGIELNDEARTAQGRMVIEFLDNAPLSLKEQVLVMPS